MNTAMQNVEKSLKLRSSCKLKQKMSKKRIYMHVCIHKRASIYKHWREKHSKRLTWPQKWWLELVSVRNSVYFCAAFCFALFMCKQPCWAKDRRHRNSEDSGKALVCQLLTFSLRISLSVRRVSFLWNGVDCVHTSIFHNYFYLV